MPLPEEVVPGDDDYVLDLFFFWDQCGRDKLNSRGTQNGRSTEFPARKRAQHQQRDQIARWV